MEKLIFSKDLTLQEPLSEEAIASAVEIMRSGRLHRYNNAADDPGETALLEQDFAALMGMKYCLACSSCGSAIYISLLAAGVKRGDFVLCNAYTLAPVPGALYNAGARPIFVEICSQHTIDLDDLEQKAKLGLSKYLLLSHMRGHCVDMEKLLDICRRHNLTLIEDSAHTMGVRWNGRNCGTFGLAGCFSTQTYKHINSGEGGLLVTDSPELMAKAILYSGSYMNYDKHISRPPTEYFEEEKWFIPNYSNRMDNLRAALLRPQLRLLDSRITRWNNLYQTIEDGLGRVPGITCPYRPQKEQYVGSSIQFNLYGQSESNIRAFLSASASRGVHIKWFGEQDPIGFTSVYTSWKYLGETVELPETTRILASLCDMRIPLTLTPDDCRLIVAIIDQTARETLAHQVTS